jgi:TP901 family phage tail tape measure protein
MGEAAAITTSILAGYGFEVDQSARVSDVLAAAAASAKTDVAAMGFAFSKAAPAAKALGLEFETTAAMLAALQDAGLGAEIAGTGLKSILFALADPSDKAAEAIQAMGINIDRFKRLVEEGKIAELFQLLGERGLDAGKAAQIFGREMGGQALILAGATDKIDGLNKAYRGAEGTAKRMADTKMQGLPGAFALLISRAEGLVLALGDAGLTTVLITIADAVGGFADALSGAPPILQQMVIGAVALGPALLALGFALKAAAIAGTGFQAIMAVLAGAAGIATLAKEFFLVAKATNLWTAAQWLLNGALVANPIGLIVAGVALLIAGVIRLISVWDEMVAAFNRADGVISGTWNAVKTFFGFGDASPESAGMAGAPPAAVVPQPTVSSVTNTTSMRMGNVNVDARGGDSKEIAQNVGAAIRDQFQNTAQDFDSGVVR